MRIARLVRLVSNVHGLHNVGAALLLASVCAPISSAATVTFMLDLSVLDQWKVYADVSDNDNFGIASYSFRLTGSTLTHDNASPLATAASSDIGEGDVNIDGEVDAADFVAWRKLNGGDETTYEDIVEHFGESPGNFEPAGFTSVRSGDNASAATTESNITVSARQNFFGIVPNPHLVYGFGQEASSFVLEGITPGGTIEQPLWGEPLLLAQGTWISNGNSLAFHQTSSLTFVTVFSEVDNPNDEVNPQVVQIANADETFVIIPFGAAHAAHPSIVPEPSTIALCALAMTGYSFFYRRNR